MKFRIAAFALVALALLSPVTAAAQQSAPVHKPMFAVLRYRGPITDAMLASSRLPLWSGKYKYLTQTYSFTMVGANPAGYDTTTTIPVYIIPIKVVIKSGTTNVTFDPLWKLANGKSMVTSVLDSPLFEKSIDYNQGGIDLGKTQYIDAFQRGNFWTFVKTNTAYHVLLGTPTVLAEQTIALSASQGTVDSSFGFPVGETDINAFDTKLQAIMAKFVQINPGVLPIFVTKDVYLTQNGCCIGGYHSFTGTQAYAYSTYVDHAGQFAQDVSALSHEIGEWMDDPLTNNTNVPLSCGILGNAQQILEVGDPEEGDANFGGHPYALGGFTYNLQDLVFVTYFGAPPATSVNKWATFQGVKLSVCENGG
jgi:hypothetical protein